MSEVFRVAVGVTALAGVFWRLGWLLAKAQAKDHGYTGGDSRGDTVA
jgi:hypothetical protein